MNRLFYRLVLWGHAGFPLAALLVLGGSCPEVRGAWSPANISTEAWYDAADSSSILTNDAVDRVSQWTDKSGNGRNATNSAPASQPTYDATGFNGLPTVSCENGSYYLRMQLPVPSTQAVFAVVRPQARTFTALFLNNQTGPGVITILPKARDGAGNTDVLKVGGSNDPAGLELYVNGSTNPVTRTQNAMYDAIITDNTNGVLARLSDVPLASITNFNLIGDTSSGWDARAVYSEIVIVSAPVTLAVQQRIEGYLAWKWGLYARLPGDHPYRYDGSFFGYETLWTPDRIGTEVWYDAASEATILMSNAVDRVSHWTDRSGNARHATNTIAGNQPTYESAGWYNGLPTVSCEDGTYYLNMGVSTPSTQIVFAVVKPQVRSFVTVFLNQSGNTFLPFADDGSGNGNTFRVAGVNDPPGLEMYVNGSIAAVAGTRDAMYDAVITDNTNGVLVRLADLALTSSSSFNRIGDSSSGWDARCKYSEIVFVDESTALDEQQRIEGYLAWKWGLEGSLEVGHPYEDNPPYFRGNGFLFIVR